MKNQNQPITFVGAALALILLGLYGITLGMMLFKVCSHEGDPTKIVFNDGVIYVVTTISGLVSALVIAQLAIIDPRKNPGQNFSDSVSSNPKVRSRTKVIANFYLGTWGVLGLAALIIGVMIYPEANETVSDIGTTWFGLAVAAGYSFFKIKPSPEN